MFWLAIGIWVFVVVTAGALLTAFYIAMVRRGLL